MPDMRLLYSALNMSGVNRLVHGFSRYRLTVLCYHSVIKDDQINDSYRCRNAVSVNQFRSHLATIRRLFNPVSAEQVLAWLNTEAGLPEHALLVTFDDGYRNNLLYAVPELAKHNVPAVFFVTTEYIGQDRLLWPQEVDELILAWNKDTLPLPIHGMEVPIPTAMPGRVALAKHIRNSCKRIHEQERVSYLERLRGGVRITQHRREFSNLYKFMTWDEVREIRNRGFEIGSHTVHHPILSQLSHDQLIHELSHSKARIERELDTECRSIAYPNGGKADVSEAVFSETRRCQYQLGFTLMERYSNSNLTNPFAVDRICIPGGESKNLFNARISGCSRLIRNAKRMWKK